jgi:hypothetical protein
VKSVAKVTLALIAASIFAGCSAVRLAYENAHVYLHYRANNYLDLDSAGSEELEERIASFFAWHRAEELPLYAELAMQAASRLEATLSRDDVVWGYDALVERARASLRAAAERAAPLLDRLTPAQIAHMQRRFAEDNRRFEREFLRGAEQERRERRARRVGNRLEEWVGRLTRAQAERVRQYSERAPLYDELRARERRRVQAEVVALAQAREASLHLAERAADWESRREPAHRQAAAAAREELFALLVDLDAMLSAEQRARALANLRRYAADFNALARRAPPYHVQ